MSILLLLADVVASLALSGRLLKRSNAAAVILLGLLYMPAPADAQDADAFALNATAEMTLAYVVTGNSPVDEMSEAGLRGLSDTLFFRTSVEPADPIGVDLERDELAFFPMLYWPPINRAPRAMPMPS